MGGFCFWEPIYKTNKAWKSVNRWQCTAVQPTLDHPLQRCSWTEEKNTCHTHKKYNWTLAEPEKHNDEALESKSRDRGRFNKKMINILVQFTGAIDIGFRKAASKATFTFTRD
jgi:hypothetical protein